MSEEDQLDVIVVGAGPAGLAAAYEAASAGLQVAVCERGDPAGSKNLSGGRLYLEPVRELCSGLLEGAPFERAVVSESIVLTDADQSMTLRLDHDDSADAPHSVTVLRAKFDAFLAAKVGEKDGFVMGEQKVDELLLEDGAVVGVKVGPEELRSRAVVAADGVLSFVAEQAGLRAERPIGNYAVGVKEVIKLDASTIEERFNVGPGQGAARMYLGEPTRGLPGGGFLYTNEDSLSLGVVVQLDALGELRDDDALGELTESFKQRPDVAPLVAGGEVVEYGAHLIPEGGFGALPSFGVPGLFLVGDAAGLVLNTGNVLRGMDLALASGALAGKSIVAFKDANPGSPECLAHYTAALRDSFVYRELQAHQRAPALLGNERLYEYYPREMTRWFKQLFEVGRDGVGPDYGGAFKQLRKDVVRWRGIKDFWRLRKL